MERGLVPVRRVVWRRGGHFQFSVIGVMTATLFGRIAELLILRVHLPRCGYHRARLPPQSSGKNHLENLIGGGSPRHRIPFTGGYSAMAKHLGCPRVRRTSIPG